MNPIDAITLEPIPSDRVVTVKAGETTYTFDLNTLARLRVSQKSFINPFTQQPFDDAVIQRVLEYSDICIHVTKVRPLTRDPEKFEFQISRLTAIGDVLLSLLQQNIPDLTQISQLFTIDIISQIDRTSIYEQDLATPIGDAPKYHSLHIASTLMNRRQHTLPRVMYPRWVEFAIRTYRDDLLTAIPPAYHRPPPIQPDPIEEDYQILHQIIESSQSLVEAAQRISRVIIPMRLAANRAHELAQELEQRFFSHCKGYILEHLIYSRVVDKANLEPFYGIEGYYYQDEYQPPNFQMAITADEIFPILYDYI